LMFYVTKDEVFKWDFAVSQRAVGWSGYEIGDKFVLLALRRPYPSTMVKIRETAKDFFKRIMRFDVSGMSKETMPLIARKLEDFQPRFIMGYPSAMYLLAHFIEKEGKPRLRPRAIITGAEQLYDYQRELFRKVFQCETYSCYGSWEIRAIASECSQHSGYHITAENVILEIVNDEGKPVPLGEEGRILATNLHNNAMPFIRYDIGDVGALSDQACPCGRGLPLLAKLSGRTTDVILTRSGRTIPGIGLPWEFLAFLGIEQFQIVQESYEKVMIKLILDREYPQSHVDELTREIISRYRPILGEDIDITVDFVDQISLTRMGKRRVVISNLPPRSEPDSGPSP
ncbi:phenylacetate--CoA ligase family protein, partial [Chloroflexota bacterium]